MFSWSSSDAVLNQTLSSKTSAAVTLNPSDLPKQNIQYDISLVIISPIAARQSSKSTHRVVRGSLSFPNLQIKGPSLRQIGPDEGIMLQGGVSFSACASETQLNFTWTQLDGPLLSLEHVIVRGMNLYIKPGSITTGKTVTFQLSAFPTDSKDVHRSFATVQIRCALPALVAIIMGGSSMEVSPQGTIILNGSLSYDPAQAVGQLNYQWSCMYQGRHCRSHTSELISLPQVPTVSLEMSSIDLQAGTVQTCLTVSSLNRQTRACVSLIISLPSTVQLDMGPFTPKLQGRSGSKEKGYNMLLNVNERLILQSQPMDRSLVSTNRSLVSRVMWESEPVLDLSEFMVENGTYLVLPPLQAFSGKVVTFTSHLQVVEQSSQPTAQQSLGANTSSAHGKSSITVLFNKAPILGTCRVEPTVGTVLETEFKVSCQGWVDDQVDGTISYSFALQPASSPLSNLSASVELRSREPTNQHKFYTSFAGLLHLSASICDQFGSCAAQVLNLTTVSAPEVSSDSGTSAAELKAQRMKDKTDTALLSASKMQDSNAMNMWAMNLAKGLPEVGDEVFVPRAPTSRQLLAPMSSADALSSTVRSSLMSAVAAAMGSSVVSSDNVLESVQSLAAVTANGPLSMEKQLEGINSALQLALYVRGQQITSTSVERFIDVLSNLKPQISNDVSLENVKQLNDIYELVSHLMVDSFLHNTVPGEAPVTFAKVPGPEAWTMMKTLSSSLIDRPVAMYNNALLSLSAPALALMPPVVNLRLVSTNIPFATEATETNLLGSTFVSDSLSVGLSAPGADNPLKITLNEAAAPMYVRFPPLSGAVDLLSCRSWNGSEWNTAGMQLTSNAADGPICMVRQTATYALTAIAATNITVIAGQMSMAGVLFDEFGSDSPLRQAFREAMGTVCGVAADKIYVLDVQRSSNRRLLSGILINIAIESASVAVQNSLISSVSSGGFRTQFQQAAANNGLNMTMGVVGLTQIPTITAIPSTDLRHTCPKDCSNGNGICQPNGVCSCFAGFESADCSTISCVNIQQNNCSNHGACVAVHFPRTTTCDCDKFYTGADCSVEAPGLKVAYVSKDGTGTGVSEAHPTSLENATIHVAEEGRCRICSNAHSEGYCVYTLKYLL